MTPTPLPPINNLYISTASAQMIAAQIKDTLATTIWDLPVFVPIIIALLSFIAALMSAIAASQANNIAKSVRSSEVLKLFFDITKELPMDGKTVLTVDQKQFICNYFEFVCFSILKKRLGKHEMELVEDVMMTPLFVNFMTDYRSKHGVSAFKYYYKWHEKQRKIRK